MFNAPIKDQAEMAAHSFAIRQQLNDVIMKTSSDTRI